MIDLHMHSSYHSFEQAQYYYRTAQEKKLFVTCGSDYHGKTKPSIGIGQHNCPIPYEKLICQLKDGAFHPERFC